MEHMVPIASSVVIIVEEFSVAHISSATSIKENACEGETSSVASQGELMSKSLMRNACCQGDSWMDPPLKLESGIALESGDLGGDSGFNPNTNAPVERVELSVSSIDSHEGATALLGVLGDAPPNSCPSMEIIVVSGPLDEDHTSLS
ncbi:hypothetical protein HAX54_009342 [Datura stramonium]|uniref:Uncharacterized protein n=1 Tax=Datura stramonium TaxID=4076 RepID=A0ABS8TEN1_DATST|nr:hypothetical protein [Datura stramonium]